jgi:hypothetical protein
MMNVEFDGKTGLQLDKDALANMLNVKTVNKPIEQRLLSTFKKSGAKSTSSTFSTFKKSGAKNRKTRSKSTFKKSGAKSRVKRIPFEQMIIEIDDPDLGKVDKA